VQTQIERQMEGIKSRVAALESWRDRHPPEAVRPGQRRGKRPESAVEHGASSDGEPER
jgi:hypothetical protein